MFGFGYIQPVLALFSLCPFMRTYMLRVTNCISSACVFCAWTIGSFGSLDLLDLWIFAGTLVRPTLSSRRRSRPATTVLRSRRKTWRPTWSTRYRYSSSAAIKKSGLLQYGAVSLACLPCGIRVESSPPARCACVWLLRLLLLPLLPPFAG